jgi:hypothetical protein
LGNSLVFSLTQFLDNLIEVNRLCHQLLSETLGSLADFDDLLAEANRQVSAPNGRITLHIFSELTDDLLPNFCFNTTTRRFVRGKVSQSYGVWSNWLNFHYLGTMVRILYQVISIKCRK